MYIVAGVVEKVTFETDFSGTTFIKKYDIEHTGRIGTLRRVANYSWTQLKICFRLVKIAEKVDIWIFFLGGENLLLPMLAAKISGRKVLLVLGGASGKIAEFRGDSCHVPLKCIFKINCILSNRIILYSENLIKEWNLEKYKNKIYVAHRHFIDFDEFKIKKEFDERDNLVGYIGRLSEEKGVLNFVKAIPEISKEKDDLEFLIGGDGQLCDKIKKHLDENNLNDKVNLAGWISHDKLPDYLNELKLVVLPSYTEGLPNIMLEAMACGTPVLATSVGGVPDVIKDGKTGFILENNSPECIAENIERLLNHPALAGIIKNARELVEKEFTYEAAVERYRKILGSF
jgi:glycosyltransferase involved in cell wall biosynthesis